MNWDLERIDVKDLDFSKDFKVIAQKKGYISGFVFWFDTTFSHGKVKVVLDTSPYLEKTHWRQGYLQLKRRIPVNQGDVLEGKFSY